MYIVIQSISRHFVLRTCPICKAISNGMLSNLSTARSLCRQRSDSLQIHQVCCDRLAAATVTSPMRYFVDLVGGSRPWVEQIRRCRYFNMETGYPDHSLCVSEHHHDTTCNTYQRGPLISTSWLL